MVYVRTLPTAAKAVARLWTDFPPFLLYAILDSSLSHSDHLNVFIQKPFLFE
jgi:hypothetical protein